MRDSRASNANGNGQGYCTHPVSRSLDNRSPSPVHRSVSCISNSSVYMNLFAHETTGSRSPSSLSGCRLGDGHRKLGEVLGRAQNVTSVDSGGTERDEINRSRTSERIGIGGYCCVGQGVQRTLRSNRNPGMKKICFDLPAIARAIVYPKIVEILVGRDLSPKRDNHRNSSAPFFFQLP
jgi:hypothetical protein